MDNLVNVQDEIRRIKVLSWLANQGRGKYHIRDFATKNWDLWPKLGISLKTQQDLEYLAAQGWIEADPIWREIDTRSTDISRYQATITEAGLSEVQDIRSRTKPARAAACRKGVL